jgi:hypothetical protein
MRAQLMDPFHVGVGCFLPLLSHQMFKRPIFSSWDMYSFPCVSAQLRKPDMMSEVNDDDDDDDADGSLSFFSSTVRREPAAVALDTKAKKRVIVRVDNIMVKTKSIYNNSCEERKIMCNLMASKKKRVSAARICSTVQYQQTSSLLVLVQFGVPIIVSVIESNQSSPQPTPNSTALFTRVSEELSQSSFECKQLFESIESSHRR